MKKSIIERRKSNADIVWHHQRWRHASRKGSGSMRRAAASSRITRHAVALQGKMKGKCERLMGKLAS